MFYVYYIQSESNSSLYYVGSTINIERRLQEHNSDKSSHTLKNSPWKLLMYVAFTDKTKALTFEQYLKTGSGREFAKRHF